MDSIRCFGRDLTNPKKTFSSFREIWLNSKNSSKFQFQFKFPQINQVPFSWGTNIFTLNKKTKKESVKSSPVKPILNRKRVGDLFFVVLYFLISDVSKQLDCALILPMAKM